MDGLPDDEMQNNAHWDAVGRLKLASKISRAAIKPFKKGGFTRTMRAIRYIKPRIKGPVFYAQEIHKLAKKYDFDKSKYVASFMAGYGRKERMPQYYFTDGEKKLYFEGILCSVPPHYNLVLKHMYSNYLQIPPISARVSHVERLWEVVQKGDKHAK